MNKYTQHLKSDILAGLIVFLVALPLCLGIALASGAPLFSGIISGIIGGIVVGVLSGSQLSVSGPAAGLTAIVLSAITQLGSFEIFLVSVIIAGVLQYVLGLIKAGVVANYFPSNVIEGMLAAIGLIIILKQLPHAIGYDKDAEGDFEFVEKTGSNTLSTIWDSISNPHYGALTLSLICVGILLAFNYSTFLKKIKYIPGGLIVVLTGIIVNEWIYTDDSKFKIATEHLVNLPIADSFNSFFSQFSFPNFSHISNPQVWITGVMIAVVGSIETLLCLDASDKLDPLKRYSSANKELRAQGIGNLLSGLLGGLPMTSVIVRTSANINSGGLTRISTITHGILLLICCIAIPSLLNKIPLAALATILIFVGYKLASPKVFVHMWHKGLNQFIPFVVTVIAILFSNLLLGVGIGLVISIFFILRSNSKLAYYFRKNEYTNGELITIKLAQEVSFLNKAAIKQTLVHLPPHTRVVIDASETYYIDNDVLEFIRDYYQYTSKDKNIYVDLYGFKNEYKIENTLHYITDKNIYSSINNDYYMQTYNQLLVNNKQWAQQVVEKDKEFFTRLENVQTPDYLWIGCSDSRVPPNEITGTKPGEIFIHRNIANMVIHTDLNLLSVLSYAVDYLKVKHIIVCGHYGCGGVKAAMTRNSFGIINKWIRNIKDVYRIHRVELDSITDENLRVNKLIELNVIEQVNNLAKTSIIQKAWKTDNAPTLHAWVYDLHDGIIKSLCDIEPNSSLDPIYEFDNL